MVRRAAIPDGDGGVRCRYADFAILLRPMKTAPVYAEALRTEASPCLRDGHGLSQTAEIAIMLALLDVIDNSHQTSLRRR